MSPGERRWGGAASPAAASVAGDGTAVCFSSVPRRERGGAPEEARLPPPPRAPLPPPPPLAGSGSFPALSPPGGGTRRASAPSAWRRGQQRSFCEKQKHLSWCFPNVSPGYLEAVLSAAGGSLARASELLLPALEPWLNARISAAVDGAAAALPPGLTVRDFLAAIVLELAEKSAEARRARVLAALATVLHRWHGRPPGEIFEIVNSLQKAFFDSEALAELGAWEAAEGGGRAGGTAGCASVARDSGQSAFAATGPSTAGPAASGAAAASASHCTLFSAAALSPAASVAAWLRLADFVMQHVPAALRDIYAVSDPVPLTLDSPVQWQPLTAPPAAPSAAQRTSRFAREIVAEFHRRQSRRRDAVLRDAGPDAGDPPGEAAATPGISASRAVANRELSASDRRACEELREKYEAARLLAAAHPPAARQTAAEQRSSDRAHKLHNFYAGEIFAILNERGGAAGAWPPSPVDLHYLGVGHALQFLEAQLNLLIREGKILVDAGLIDANDGVLTVYTGRGQHSAQGVPRLAPAVARFLAACPDLRWRRGTDDGVFLVDVLRSKPTRLATVNGR